MVLVRTETGQLVMVPQQVLAQAQAKTQQGGGAIIQRPATPTAGATAPQTVRLASPAQTRMVQSTSTVQKTISVAPGGVTVKMPPPQKGPTVITGNKPSPPTISTPAPPARGPLLSTEMQENVKKCKNFLATLIKLASHNSPSPDTSKNVKALVQDLLDAKIEPEEFTTRLQAELKSSPQPYLIPFLKKSLPSLRQSLLTHQQNLMASTSAPPIISTSIRPRLPISPGGTTVRLNTPLVGVRAGVPARSPVVFNQTLRPSSVLSSQHAHQRTDQPIIGRSPLNVAPANQRKLSDPGGGTFR
ncbi:hypothetical protein NQZ68_039849 [Dissostichus eleginoides]|nr:hypothetical protein NQZ68_039849 [Dissostichus eleginoides]